jgi:hypothetical protein
MKKLLTFGCTALLAMAAAAPCSAATSPWDGTWKLNPDRSRLTGQTFTITQKGDMFHYVRGTLSYDFACDGKPYPTIADRTVTCTGSPETGYDLVAMAGDRMRSKSHRTISPDGKLMMITGESTRPGGNTVQYSETYKRTAGKKGMAGTWKDVRRQSNGSDTIKIAVTGDEMHLEYAELQESVTAKLDGTESPVTGPTVPPGVTQSTKADGPRKFTYYGKYQGTVIGEGVRTISSDGKTMIVESWDPGKANEKAILVYEKQ